MRYILLIFLYLSCKDQDTAPPAECDAARIEGKWQFAGWPQWHYDFRDPHLYQWVEIGGDTVTRQHYIYATRHDTLWASGPGGERTWLLCFPDDTTCHMREWNSGKWSPTYLLYR